MDSLTGLLIQVVGPLVMIIVGFWSFRTAASDTRDLRRLSARLDSLQRSLEEQGRPPPPDHQGGSYIASQTDDQNQNYGLYGTLVSDKQEFGNDNVPSAPVSAIAITRYVK